MGTQPPSVEAAEPAQAQPYHASSLVVPPRPDECGFSLREDEFRILCEGDISDLRAGRDLCIGSLVTALAALAGAFYTTDWDIVWQPGHRKSFLYLAILLILAAGSAVGVYIYRNRLNHTRRNSAYARLVTE